MKLEDQVVSLELAKRLKELGIKKKSMFYYIEHVNGHKIFPVITDHDREIFNLLIHDVMPPALYSAYTVTELGELLPEQYISCKTQGGKKIGDYKKYWLCYDDADGCDNENTQMEETEVDARAKMLIHLLENGLIKNEN